MKKEIKGKAIETVDAVTAEEIVKFEVGKTYYTRGFDKMTVTSRTEKYVTVEHNFVGGGIVTSKVSISEQTETVKVKGIKFSADFDEAKKENWAQIVRESLLARRAKVTKENATSASIETVDAVSVRKAIEWEYHNFKVGHTYDKDMEYTIISRDKDTVTYRDWEGAMETREVEMVKINTHDGRNLRVEYLKDSTINARDDEVAYKPAKFEVGKTYGRYTKFTVERRTTYYVTLSWTDNYGEQRSRKVKVYSDAKGERVEFFKGVTIMAKDEVQMAETTKAIETADTVTAEEIVNIEDEGSNDEPDDYENVIDNLPITDNVDESIDRYARWKDKVMPYTYHVLALNIQGVLTFDGQRISQKNAAAEVARALNYGFGKQYKDIRAILLTDQNANHYLSKSGKLRYGRIYASSNVRIVDFGRDEIPYINQKVAAIVAYYQTQAKKADEEKAREIAYKASPEYKLETLELDINTYESDRAYCEQFIKSEHEVILGYLRYIAKSEDTIQAKGLTIDAINAKIAELEKQKKALKDEIATRDAYTAINTAAVDIKDDGSNDEPDDEEITVEYNIDVEEEEDDELVDPPEVPETEPVITNAATAEIFNGTFARKDFKLAIQPSEEVVVADTIQFNLQTFSEGGYSVIADSPATIDTAVAYADVDFTPVIDDSVTDTETCTEEKSVRRTYQNFFRVTTLIKSSLSGRLVGADRKFYNVTDALNYAKNFVKKNTPADCLDCSVYFDEYDKEIWDYVSTPLYGYEVNGGNENKFIDRKAINRLKRANTQPTFAALFPDLVQ